MPERKTRAKGPLAWVTTIATFGTALVTPSEIASVALRDRLIGFARMGGVAHPRMYAEDDPYIAEPGGEGPDARGCLGVAGEPVSRFGSPGQYSFLMTKYVPRMVPANVDFCRTNLNRDAGDRRQMRSTDSTGAAARVCSTTQ